MFVDNKSMQGINILFPSQLVITDKYKFLLDFDLKGTFVILCGRCMSDQE